MMFSRLSIWRDVQNAIFRDWIGEFCLSWFIIDNGSLLTELYIYIYNKLDLSMICYKYLLIRVFIFL